MYMMLVDIVGDCYRMLASAIGYDSYRIAQDDNPTLSTLQVPRTIPAGVAMMDLTGNLYVATDTLYMYGVESIVNLRDVASNGATWINSTLSDGIDAAIHILQSGLHYVYYSLTLPAGELPDGTPEAVIDARDRSIPDITGVWSWDIPQIDDNDVAGRWVIAAMSKYRDGGILRPQYAWLWSDTALDDYSIITRCMSQGPYDVCDGYYGTYNPTLGYYVVPGPTYPMGYYHISVDPYSEQSTINISDYYPGIDVSLDHSSPYVTTSVYVPEPSNPVVYRFPGPDYVIPGPSDRGRVLQSMPLSLLDMVGLRHIGERLSNMGLVLGKHENAYLLLNGDRLSLNGDNLML